MIGFKGIGRRAEGREQRAESREQRAKGREQRGESKEQRAEGWRLFFSLERGALIYNTPRFFWMYIKGQNNGLHYTL